MKIGIIGSGISGLSAAWLLSAQHSVTVFEKEARSGGHSHTVQVTYDDRTIAVDTGFIVYNENNYPDLTRAFNHLGVATQASDMSFSASIGDGAFEYSGKSLAALAAQKRNLARPAFWRMLADIKRFNDLAQAILVGPALDLTLGEFLDRHRLGGLFRQAYLLPMGAAIWSAPVAAMLDFPATSFLRFFANHGLLSPTDQHAWRTTTHRSADYVTRMSKGFASEVRRSCAAIAIVRKEQGIEVIDSRGQVHHFDEVVLACHADQSLAIMNDADAQERRILESFTFQPNRAVLHRDTRLMPKRNGVWSSWNYLAPADLESGARVSVTYWMNRLQNIDERYPLFVTLNPLEEPQEDMVFGRYDYDHPVLDQTALSAQTAMPAIQGRGGIWHAGAWLGYGFHEDGIRSGIAVARALGARPPWEDAGDDVALPLARRA